MSTNNDNNKRIAKNTMLLYVRMLFTMAVTLYTSRILLNELGVEDFGIYNVVGGIVTMFSLLSGSLSASISRFITFELGQENVAKLKTIFSTSVNIQIILSLIIIFIAEIIGVWFLNAKMNIPAERMEAANWVLQCSILTFAVNLISVPYNASIIAHEKMSAFAYISILEVTLKLLVCYCLYISLFDKLISYAVLLLTISIIIRFVYGVYCKRHFDECRYHLILDKELFKRMANFAGWNFFGNGAYLLNTQGINILMNLFFGTTVNAARGIATQVESAVQAFVGNFTTALNPQITKNYAKGNKEYLFELICRGAKYSYFLMFFFVVPIVVETPYILKLWLKIVPDYAVVFTRLTLASSLLLVLGNTLVTWSCKLN